jgi:hypothetical protein
MRTGIVAAGAVALALCLGAPAAALADVEPNDGITQAEGPLAGAVTYSGALSTDNDVDWYAFYVAGQTQLDISVTVPADSPCGGWFDEADLLDTDGQYIASAEPDVNETQHILYTTPPGTNRFLLTFDACNGYKYSFRLDPGSAIVSGPGIVAPAATGEPNESPDQAFGPLLGGTPYAGRIDTLNDEDWFYFYTGGAGALDVSLTGTDGGCSADGTLYAASDVNESLASASADANETEHLRYTASGAGKFLVHVEDGCIGTGYQLRVDPSTAIVPALPALAPPPPAAAPQPSSRCIRARHGVRRWRAAIRRTKGKLRLVHTRAARRVLKHKLAAERRTLKRAKDRVTIYC